MELLRYEENFLEVKVFHSELEQLNEGKPIEARWIPEGKIFLNVIDPESKDIEYDRYGVSLLKKEYAVLDGRGLNIDIHVPWGVVNNGFILANNFRKKDGTLKIDPPNDSFDDLHIRVVYPSITDRKNYGFEL